MKTSRKAPKAHHRREAWMVLKDRVALATLMAIRNVKHRQLAEAAGWKSHGHVGHLLSGRKKTVTPTSAIRIAQLFGVRVEDLFVPRATTNAGHVDHPKRAA